MNPRLSNVIKRLYLVQKADISCAVQGRIYRLYITSLRNASLPLQLFLSHLLLAISYALVSLTTYKRVSNKFRV